MKINLVDAFNLCRAVRAPWGDEPALGKAIAQLRHEGRTVICGLPGNGSETGEFRCDAELTLRDGQWIVGPLAGT